MRLCKGKGRSADWPSQGQYGGNAGIGKRRRAPIGQCTHSFPDIVYLPAFQPLLLPKCRRIESMETIMIFASHLSLVHRLKWLDPYGVRVAGDTGPYKGQ